jgi:hypothetical protein
MDEGIVTTLLAPILINLEISITGNLGEQLIKAYRV